MVEGLVFQYFYQIGAGLALGVGSVALGCWLVYRWISNRLDGRNKKVDKGRVKHGVV